MWVYGVYIADLLTCAAEKASAWFLTCGFQVSTFVLQKRFQASRGKIGWRLDLRQRIRIPRTVVLIVVSRDTTRQALHSLFP